MIGINATDPNISISKYPRPSASTEFPPPLVDAQQILQGQTGNHSAGSGI